MSGKIEFCPKYIDFNEVITSVLSEMEGYTSDKGIQILVDNKCSESTVWAEEHLILQVLVNLLSNAIKFSPKNGIVVISISNSVNESKNINDDVADFLEVKIIDQGPGVPENEFSSIFDQFVQSSTTQVGTGGTGLGLAISQHILELHNGKIQVTNMESSGACFSFLLATKRFDNLS
jgi:signal transduction histidine kinase